MTCESASISEEGAGDILPSWIMILCEGLNECQQVSVFMLYTTVIAGKMPRCLHTWERSLNRYYIIHIFKWL